MWLKHISATFLMKREYMLAGCLVAI